MDQAILKLTNVNLFAGIDECPAAMRLRIYEITHIFSSRGEFEISFSHFEVEFEEALINSVASNKNSHAMAHIITVTSEILVIFASNNREIILTFKIFLGKVILLQPITVIN